MNRDEIWLVTLPLASGREQGGQRPAVVLQDPWRMDSYSSGHGGGRQGDEVLAQCRGSDPEMLRGRLARPQDGASAEGPRKGFRNPGS